MSSAQLPLDFSGDTPPKPWPHAPLPQLLDQWVAAGWLRAADRAVARWVSAHEPQADPWVVLSLVLASHQAGQGHVCLDLADCLADPVGVLKMPANEAPWTSAAPALPSPGDLWSGITLSDWLAGLRQVPTLIYEVAAHDPGAQPIDTRDEFAPSVPPFVLDGARLYLRRYWQQEQAIAVQIRARLRAGATSVPQSIPVVRSILDQLFVPTAGNEEPDWQKIACALAIRHRFAVMTGGPGTGKTTTVVRFLILSQILAFEAGLPPPLIRLCAPTGKAAARLKQSILGQLASLVPQFSPTYPELLTALPKTVETLHRLIGIRPNQPRPVHHEANWLAADMVVIDEASMVGQELMAKTLAALSPDTRVVLIGDKDQLASVEPGAVLGELCAHTTGLDTGYDDETRAWIAQTTGFRLAGPDVSAVSGSLLDQATVLLRQSHRFAADSPISLLARAVNAGDAETTIRLLRTSADDPSVQVMRDDPEQDDFDRTIVSALQPWLSRVGRLDGPPAEAMPEGEQDAWARSIFVAHQQAQVLCALRQGPQGVVGLNARIERILRRAQLLPDHPGADPIWYAGRPVLITRNDASLHLANGDIGLTLPYWVDGAYCLRVAFLGDDPESPVRWMNPNRLPHCETAFALTVHKAQGSEFGHCLFVLPGTPNPVLTRELIYTAMTRSRQRFTLVAAPQDPALTILAQGVRRRVQRSGQLGALCRA